MVGDSDEFTEDNSSNYNHAIVSVGLSCALETFSEGIEVLNMINNIPYLCTQESDSRSYKIEKSYERMQFILGQYKEQPHLLNSFLKQILNGLLSLVRDEESSDKVKHIAFKYLSLVINVKGHKTMVRYLPHKVSDMQPVLTLLEEQDLLDTNTWETRYCLLLWLSVIITLPFNMNLLNNPSDLGSVTTRVLEVGKKCLLSMGKCQNAAALLLAKLVIRKDVKDTHLNPLVTYLADKSKEVNGDSREWIKFGPLTCISAILKHAERVDLLPSAPFLLTVMFELKNDSEKFPLLSKLIIKIITRLGLVFLKPREAIWRYKKKICSLEHTLTNDKKDSTINSGENVEVEEQEEEEEEDDDQDIPPEIEDVVDELIVGLSNEYYIARWSAAKGIGRIMSRLTKKNGDDISSAVLEVLDPLSSEEAWHGACMAIAELAKRGLLLPNRLPDLIPLLSKALVFEKLRGYTSVGTSVRDAACYMCWAIARAYHPSITQPYVEVIAKRLMALACFDREVNCRRAAAAALQECVGRLGNIPHGIEVMSTVNYYSVGNRKESYLTLSVFVAQFDEYCKYLIDFLLEYKINNWDPEIRKLTAVALSNLTTFAPQYVTNSVLKQLLSTVCITDAYAQHGCILAIGEILYSLSKIDTFVIDPDILKDVEGLVPLLRDRSLLPTLDLNLITIACLNYIENCCKTKLPLNGKHVIDIWQNLIDDCLSSTSAEMRESAAMAFKQLFAAYYSQDAMKLKREEIITNYKSNLFCNDMNSRIGYAIALGYMPATVLNEDGHIRRVVEALIQCTEVTEDTLNWAEARSVVLKALANICTTVIHNKKQQTVTDLLTNVFEAFLRSFHDYTTDHRGDIGVWVREAALEGTKDLLILIVDEASELLTGDIVFRAFVEIAQQAVEKINRTRGIAGRIFYSLIHKSGTPVPFVPAEQKLRSIFTHEACDNVNWTYAQDTFPLFIQLLTIPEYSYNILLGLVSSVGGLTQSLSSDVINDLYKQLQNQPCDILTRLCNLILDLFEKYNNNNRIIIPLLYFTPLLLQSNCFHPVLNDHDSTFGIKLFTHGKEELFKSPTPKKISAVVEFFCQLIQIHGEASRRSLSQLSVMLCHRSHWLRQLVAEKLSVALTLHASDIGIEEHNVEKVLALLECTNWKTPNREVLRGTRNTICERLNIRPPKYIQ